MKAREALAPPFLCAKSKQVLNSTACVTSEELSCKNLISANLGYLTFLIKPKLNQMLCRKRQQTLQTGT